MSANDHLAALWQPSHLFAIRTLAHDVATHAAAAIAADDDIEAVLAAGRFGRWSGRLVAELTPYAEHNLDKPDLWPPGAEGKLLAALLSLRNCLQHLLPHRSPIKMGRGRKTLMAFDCEDARATLKGLRPVVDRLQALVGEVDRRIGERFTTAATTALPEPPSATELPGARQPPGDESPPTDDPYITAKHAVALTGLTYPQISKLCCEGGPVRFRRPRGQRLQVHAADLARYVTDRNKAGK